MRVAFLCVDGLPLVHICIAVGIDQAIDIEDPDVFALRAERNQKVETGKGGGASARGDNLDVFPEIFPASSSPFRMAAATMIAVPCWSSWKTGICIFSRRIRSTSKHSGALMSSRLMPPNVGSSEEMVETMPSIVGASIFDVEDVDASEFLEQYRLAFHNRFGREGADIAKAKNGGAVRYHGHEVGARGVLRSVMRVVVDRETGRADARRIGERQVALVAERFDCLDFKFARRADSDDKKALAVEGLRRQACFPNVRSS